MKKFLFIPFIVFQINAVEVYLQDNESELIAQNEAETLTKIVPILANRPPEEDEKKCGQIHLPNVTKIGFRALRTFLPSMQDLSIEQLVPTAGDKEIFNNLSEPEKVEFLNTADFLGIEPLALLRDDFAKQLFGQDQEYSKLFENEESLCELKDCLERLSSVNRCYLSGKYAFKKYQPEIVNVLRKIHLKNNESRIENLEQSSIVTWGLDNKLMVGGQGTLKVYPDFKKSDWFVKNRFNDLSSAHCTKLAISNDSLYTLLLLFDPKSKKLALNPKSNTLQLYSQDKCIKEIPDVNDFTWFPNSQEFLLVHLNGKVARYNIADGTIYTMESGSSFKERRIAMSPDCSRFALFEENFTRVFDSETLKKTSQFSSYKDGAIVDAQSGKLAAAAYNKNNLFLYSWANEGYKETTVHHWQLSPYIQDIVWNKEGDLLAVADGAVKLFDTDLQPIDCLNYGPESSISRVQWSLDDTLIGAGSHDVMVWDRKKNPMKYKIFDSKEKERAISQVAISPDGKNLALLCKLRGNDYHDEVVIVPIDDSEFVQDMNSLDPLQVMLVAYLFNNCISGKNNQINELIYDLPKDVCKAILARTVQNYEKMISAFKSEPAIKYGKMEE